MKLTASLRKLRLGKLLAIVLAGVVLITTTACNGVDSARARAQNPPVQMGGQNNPHKGNGDGYSDYQKSADRSNKRASLPTEQLVATAASTELLYPGQADSGNNVAGREQAEVREEMMRDATRIPAKPQYELDPTHGNENVLDRAGQTFKDASSFAKDSAEYGAARFAHPEDYAQEPRS